MPELLITTLLTIISYLIGGIPAAYLGGRFWGPSKVSLFVATFSSP